MTALRELGPDVTGVWIGGGELQPKISRLAGALPGVRLVLAGERDDVPALLPALDVFALPSRYEGLPTAVVEAMVSGVPVVATAVNAVPDVVIPGETGLLVPPGRPDLLASAVRHLLDSPATAARMAAAARRQVGKRYGEAALGHALAAAYDPGRADDGPADDGPADDGPADDGPADDGPADDGPADDAPAPPRSHQPSLHTADPYP